MNEKEVIEQLESLIETWQLDEADLNQTDINAMKTLLKEKQELKEQLEDMTLCRDIASGHRKEVQDRETILLNQQKEFIEWLENYIDALIQQKETVAELDVTEVHILMTLEEVLSKYKEIIGGKE